MYTCSMHPDVRQETPGKCFKCGMDLVEEGSKPLFNKPKRKITDFMPLIIAVLIVAVFTAVALWWSDNYELMQVMRYFEGFFFLVFAIFKLLNWRGFVDAYSTYDIIAKRSRAYGWAYPVIELALAAGYIFEFHLLFVASATVVLMSIGAIGVFKEVSKGNEIPCACLGVVFKLPMTWVTLIEDLAMAAMAVAMIFILLT